MQVNATLHTDGTGYWSTRKAAVNVISLHLQWVDNEESLLDVEEEYGELVVGFDTATWDCSKDGLIYTDDLFLQELRTLLTNLGYASDDVSYSEQGMQGKDFVSCDVGSAFIASYKVKHADEYAALLKELCED